MYTVVAVGVALILIIKISPKFGRENILVYISICSCIGSLTVMACKGLGIVLKRTFSGYSELGNPVSWMLVISCIICVLTQMIYLNKALDVFNTSIVTPIYYVMFTTCTIIASAILFKEWENLVSRDVLGAICGFMTIIVGVFLLHAFRESRFSLGELITLANSGNRSARSDDASTVLMSDLKDYDSDEVVEYSASNDVNSHLIENDISRTL